MYKMMFSGLGTALVTPFCENGDIDYDALSRIIECQIAGGADFLCILATTAETPTLTLQEKAELRSFITRQVRGRLPIVAGCGGNSTRAVCEELSATDWKGINAILSVVPYYNKPSQEGLFQHFTTIGKASPLPVMLYNVPSRTGVNMTADTTLRIARECENVIAIKEASGDMEQIRRIIEQCPEHFKVFSGDDALALDIMRMGGEGVISVIANGMIREFAKMIHLAQEGQFEDATSINSRFAPLYPLMFHDGNPAGIKALMSQKGMLENTLRLPLVTATQQTQQKIQELI